MNTSVMSSGIGDNPALLDTSCDSASHSQNTCSQRGNLHSTGSSLINECDDELSRNNIILEVGNSTEHSQVQIGHVPYNTPLDGFHYNLPLEIHSQKCDVLDQVSKSLANLLSQEHSMDVLISQSTPEREEMERKKDDLSAITAECPVLVSDTNELIHDKDVQYKSQSMIDNENTEIKSSQNSSTHQIEFACKLELMPSCCKNNSNHVHNAGTCNCETDKISLSSNNDSERFITSESSEFYSSEESLLEYDLSEDDEVTLPLNQKIDCSEVKVSQEDPENSGINSVLCRSNPVTCCDEPVKPLSHLSAPIISDLTLPSGNSFGRHINDMSDGRNDEELQTSCDDEVIADVKITMDNLMEKCAAVFVSDCRNANSGANQYPNWESAGEMNGLDMNAQCEYGVTDINSECTLPTESLGAGLVCTVPRAINEASDLMEIGKLAECLAPVDFVCRDNHGQEMGNSDENVIALNLHSSESRIHKVEEHTEALESVNIPNSQVKCDLQNMENVPERLSQNPDCLCVCDIEMNTGEQLEREDGVTESENPHNNFMETQQCTTSDLFQSSSNALGLHVADNSPDLVGIFSSQEADPCVAVRTEQEEKETIPSLSIPIIEGASCVVLGQPDCKEEDKPCTLSEIESKTDQQSDICRTEEKHNFLMTDTVKKENLHDKEFGTFDDKGPESLNSSLIPVHQNEQSKPGLQEQEISFSPLSSVTSSLETESVNNINENTEIVVKKLESHIHPSMKSRSIKSCTSEERFDSFHSADGINDAEMATETDNRHEYDTISVKEINTIPASNENIQVCSNFERDTSVANIRSTNKQQLQKTVRDPPSKVRENTNYRVEEDHQLFCTQQFSASLSDVSIIDYFKDGKNSSEALSTINLRVSVDSHECDADHLVPSNDHEVLGHLTSAVYENETTMYGIDLPKGSNQKSTEDHKLTHTSSPCFKWKYAPSLNLDDDLPYDCKQYDEVVTVVPLKTCTRPIRVGLSKRYRAKPLHEKHCKM